MKASELLQQRRDDYEPFTPRQMDALSDVVEAAEGTGWSDQDRVRLDSALTALKEALDAS